MVDESTTPGPQGGRNAASREGGGFRIRLSDNEMRAARSIQEAFRLRSTVAVLGFSVRTIAQLLEEGKLDALVAEHKSQTGSRGPAREGGRGGTGGSRAGRQERPPRVDPFARPARPAGTSGPAAEAEAPDKPAEVAEPAQAAASEAPAESAETSGEG